MTLSIYLVAGRNRKWSTDLNRWVNGKCWLCWISDPRLHLVRIPVFALKTEIKPGDRNIEVQVHDWLGSEITNEAWRMQLEMEAINANSNR